MYTVVNEETVQSKTQNSSEHAQVAVRLEVYLS